MKGETITFFSFGKYAVFHLTRVEYNGSACRVCTYSIYLVESSFLQDHWL